MTTSPPQRKRKVAHPRTNPKKKDSFILNHKNMKETKMKFNHQTSTEKQTTLTTNSSPENQTTPDTVLSSATTTTKQTKSDTKSLPCKGQNTFNSICVAVDLKMRADVAFTNYHLSHLLATVKAGCVFDFSCTFDETIHPYESLIQIEQSRGESVNFNLMKDFFSFITENGGSEIINSPELGLFEKTVHNRRAGGMFSLLNSFTSIDPNVQSKTGHTALMSSVICNHDYALETLLFRRPLVDMDIQDADGKSFHDYIKTGTPYQKSLMSLVYKRVYIPEKHGERTKLCDVLGKEHNIPKVVGELIYEYTTFYPVTDTKTKHLAVSSSSSSSSSSIVDTVD